MSQEVLPAEVQIFLNPPLYVFLIPLPGLQNFDIVTSLTVLQRFSVYKSVHDEKFMIYSLNLAVNIG